MTDKITLSQDEVEHINQRYREAHGEAIGRMAAMSVMGSTIEELERENAQLRAELAAIKPDWKDAPKSAVWRAYDNDGSLLFWTAAANPEAVDDDYGWSSLGIIDTENWRFPNWCDTLERRPEET